MAVRRIVDAVQDGTFRVMSGKDARMVDEIAKLVPRRAIDMVADRTTALLG